MSKGERRTLPHFKESFDSASNAPAQVEISTTEVREELAADD